MSEISSEELLRLHVAGATLRHAGPFSDLEVPCSQGTLDKAFYDKWVVPFYMAFMGGRSPLGEQLDHFKRIWSSIDPDIVASLLEDFDWRTRTVGAYFAALKRMDQFEDQIGRLLLRSDVCYAGSAYCIALATFNSKTGVSFFTRYLDHYLRQVDLWFNQGDVLAALTYLDQKNGTNHASLFQSRWQTFIANKPNRDLSRDIENFTAIMDGVNELRAVLVA